REPERAAVPRESVGGRNAVRGLVPVRKTLAALAVLPPQTGHQRDQRLPGRKRAVRGRVAGDVLIRLWCHGPRLRQARGETGHPGRSCYWPVSRSRQPGLALSI